MDPKVLREIAESFYTFFRTGHFVPVIEDLSILSTEDAYQCQEIYSMLRCSDGDRPAGYKVGCTSAAIRRQFGFNNPICGRLMNPGVFDEGIPLDIKDFHSLAIEPEFVLTIKNDLSNDHASDEELLESIEYVQPGIELHHYLYHYPTPTRQELICSNGIHAGQVIGRTKVDPREIHWTLEGVAVFINGELMSSGVAAEIMGGPLESLRFLIKHLKQTGEVLKAGEKVIPGSATPLIPVKSGDKVTCSFTNAGSVTAHFD